MTWRGRSESRVGRFPSFSAERRTETAHVTVQHNSGGTARSRASRPGVARGCACGSLRLNSTNIFHHDAFHVLDLALDLLGLLGARRVGEMLHTLRPQPKPALTLPTGADDTDWRREHVQVESNGYPSATAARTTRTRRWVLPLQYSRRTVS